MIFINKSIRLPLSKTHPESNQFWPSLLTTVQATIYCLNLRVAFPQVYPVSTLSPSSSFSTYQQAVIFQKCSGILLKPSECFPWLSEQKHTPFAKAYRPFMIWILLLHFLSHFSHTGLLSILQTQPFFPHLTAFELTHPSSLASRHNCLLAITHDSDKMSFSIAQAKALPPSPPKQSLSV